jgi:hypothetical protein
MFFSASDSSALQTIPRNNKQTIGAHFLPQIIFPDILHPEHSEFQASRDTSKTHCLVAELHTIEDLYPDSS